ncbi:MAG: hypothetical protein DI566_06850 [Microbacterium sp.]|nr:MAG: hypothetical protein DI566_06850 [Microbacterium sp.]
MRQIADIEARIRQHVEERWADDVAAEVASGSTWWPRRYALGRPDAATIEDRYDDIIDLIDQWRTWASLRGAAVVESNIRVDGATYPVISHISVPSLDVAADVAGESWQTRLLRARAYAAIVDARFPHRRAVLAKTVAAVADWSLLDVELLAQAASWFGENPDSRLSPRQVPLAGFHTKWLESRRSVVARLAGLDDLGLLPAHPSRIHFTYLDPRHLQAGGRRHESATVGDTFTPAYPTELVIICENKDTAIHFPELAGAIAVEGAGSGATAFASFSWLRDAPLVVYWGDMDVDGLRILSQFRTAGIAARSLFMDVPAYERWEEYGTNTDKRGDSISADERPAPENLEEHERALYELLNNPVTTRYRRVEQERIPLQTARAAVVQMRDVKSR